MNTQSKRIDLVAAFALALGVFAATPVLAKDGSPTLGGAKDTAASANVFSGTDAATDDFTPSKNRYGKR